jgi:predicted nucleic acid-binding protein
MTEILVDSGIIVKWFVSEPDSIETRLIYNEYENGNLGLLAPDLLYVEFGNVIWKKLILQNFDETDAAFAIEQFKKISFTLTPTTVLFDDAFQIAV